MDWLGKNITLEGKSRKGKQRVQRDGATGWTVTIVEDKIQCSSENGPWLLIENGQPNAMRWVHADNDDNFLIRENEK